MSMNDTVSDMLTRIRNGIQIQRGSVDVIGSRLNRAMSCSFSSAALIRFRASTRPRARCLAKKTCPICPEPSGRITWYGPTMSLGTMLGGVGVVPLDWGGAENAAVGARYGADVEAPGAGGGREIRPPWSRTLAGGEPP